MNLERAAMAAMLAMTPATIGYTSDVTAKRVSDAQTDLILALLEYNPLADALAYCETRIDDEFYRRLAGSLRKALALG